MSAAPKFPDGAELEFARNTRTGTVHVLPYQPPQWEDGAPMVVVPNFAAESLALLDGTVMLCGERLCLLAVGWGELTGCFPDDAICGGCVRALGDQSPLAFAHEQPGDSRCKS